MDSYMLISPLLPCFLKMYRQSTSGLGCKLLYIVVIFLVFLSTDLTTLQLDCSTLFDSKLHSDVFTEDPRSVCTSDSIVLKCLSICDNGLIIISASLSWYGTFAWTICQSVSLQSVLWQNDWLDPDCVCSGEWDWSRDGYIR